jgi:hypothetical protein
MIKKWSKFPQKFGNLELISYKILFEEGFLLYEEMRVCHMYI